MEEKVNVWKANLTSGLILGLVGVVFTLLLYFLDLTTNRSVGYIFLLISAILLYFFIKSYRDNQLHGNITYGQSVGAGIIIFLYYSIIAAIFTYILYKVIDPGLTDKMLAFTEDTIRRQGRVPESSMDTVMSFQRKMMQPGILAIGTIFFTMIFGTIITLLVSIFTRKEGNPLIDAPAN